MNYDDWGKYTCSVCNFEWESESDLVRHEREHDRTHRGTQWRARPDPGPTDDEVNEAIASIAEAAKDKEHHED
jgi:hypothetical protein